MKTKIQRNSWPQTSVLLLVSEVARLPSTPLVQSKEWTQTEYLGNTYDICYMKLIMRYIHSTYTHIYLYIYIRIYSSMAHETFVWHLPISLGDNNKQRWKATMDAAVHWGANPGKLDLPAADSRGNSSEHLRAGSNISRRRTADDYWQFAINTQGKFGLLLLCVFFWLFSILICSNLFCIFVDSFCTTEKPQCFKSGGILTIAYMMRLSGVLLGTLLLIIVHASILQRSKTKSSSGRTSKRTCHQTVMMQCDESWCHGFISCASLCCPPRDWYSGLGCLDALGHTCMHLFPAKSVASCPWGLQNDEL